MKLRHVEAFNAIMKTGTISAAAKRMHMSQPAVSRILQHAETQLGYLLFERTPSGMVPTERALRLFPHIERLFVNLSVVQEQAKELRAHTEHSLRIGVVPAIGTKALPLALAKLYDVNPQFEVHIQTQHSSSILQACALQQIDVGIAFDVPPHPNVESRTMCDAPVVCVAPVGMLRASRRIGLADLAHQRVISLSSQDPLGQLINRAFVSAGVFVKGAITVQTYHVALAMAEAGLGVSLIDAISAASADRSKVDTHLLDMDLAIAIKALRPLRPDNLAISNDFISHLSTVLHQLTKETLHD
jgi:DNA-binding transcriptional LysR family regulator